METERFLERQSKCQEGDCRNARMLIPSVFLLPVDVKIRSRIISVKGPRGELHKDLKHLSVSFEQPSKTSKTILISLHHGNRKNVAALRTVKSLIQNLIIGVTKGYKYKMRYVYAHFPINVNIEKNKETGLGEVEIR